MYLYEGKYYEHLDALWNAAMDSEYQNLMDKIAVHHVNKYGELDARKRLQERIALTFDAHSKEHWKSILKSINANILKLTDQ